MEEVTRAQFDEFRASATDLLIKAYEEHERMYATYLFQNEDEEKTHFVVPDFMMATAETKFVVGKTVKEKIKEHKINRVCFCTEAYTLEMGENDKKPTGSLENDPRSIEILMLHFECPDFKHTTQFKITREGDRESKIIAIEPYMDKDISDIGLGGNFAGFFEEE